MASISSVRTPDSCMLTALSACTPTSAVVLTVPNEVQDDVQNTITANWH